MDATQSRTTQPKVTGPLADEVIRPFQAKVPDEAIADLKGRIAATRWPTKELVADRSQGVQLATMRQLARYWANDYD